MKRFIHGGERYPVFSLETEEGFAPDAEVDVDEAFLAEYERVNTAFWAMQRKLGEMI